MHNTTNQWYPARNALQISALQQMSRLAAAMLPTPERTQLKHYFFNKGTENKLQSKSWITLTSSAFSFGNPKVLISTHWCFLTRPTCVQWTEIVKKKTKFACQVRVCVAFLLSFTLIFMFQCRPLTTCPYLFHVCPSLSSSITAMTFLCW